MQNQQNKNKKELTDSFVFVLLNCKDWPNTFCRQACPVSKDQFIPCIVYTTKISNAHQLIMVFLFIIIHSTILLCTQHGHLLTYFVSRCCGHNSYGASFKYTLQHNVPHYSPVVIVGASHNTILHNVYSSVLLSLSKQKNHCL